MQGKIVVGRRRRRRLLADDLVAMLVRDECQKQGQKRQSPYDHLFYLTATRPPALAKSRLKVIRRRHKIARSDYALSVVLPPHDRDRR